MIFALTKTQEKDRKSLQLIWSNKYFTT